MASTADRAMSVRLFARHWCVSEKKVRAWIARGLLAAVDVGNRRRQLRITPAAIAELERRLAVGPVRGRKKREAIDPEIAALLE
jgi:hypothetical protein